MVQKQGSDVHMYITRNPCTLSSLGRWKLDEDEASVFLYVEFSNIMYLTQLLVMTKTHERL